MARLTNQSASVGFGSLRAEVSTLTNNNQIQNTEGGLPTGVGARVVAPLSGALADGLLSPTEFVDVPFVVCLTNLSQFQLRVNVLGVAK